GAGRAGDHRREPDLPGARAAGGRGAGARGGLARRWDTRVAPGGGPVRPLGAGAAGAHDRLARGGRLPQGVHRRRPARTPRHGGEGERVRAVPPRPARAGAPDRAGGLGVVMKPLKVLHVVGARPNFMKVGPVHRALEATGAAVSVVVHTGQHYDAKMSDVFFRDLGLPEPDHHLGVGGGTHAEQTARVMLAFEPVLLDEQPDLVLVVGDVNSTLAAALVAAKLQVPVAHVEAGLRSFDRAMPEELNRLCTDALSDLLFVTEQSGLDNLRREGVPDAKVHFVGNVMIDSLVAALPKARAAGAVERLGLPPRGFVLMTMHRPSNVDEEAPLREVVRLVEALAARLPVVLPLHPRTAGNLARFGLRERLDR